MSASPDSRPVPKVVAAGLGGATATVVLWIIETTSDLEVPSAVSAATATLFAFAAGYLKEP